MNGADRLEMRRPDYRQISSEMAVGFLYAVRDDRKRLLIAGSQGETVLTVEQSIALFYELGEILQDVMEVEL